MASRIRCIRPRVNLTGEGPAIGRCGSCRGCRVRHKMAWTGRCLLELRDHQFARVLTLTYGSEEKRLAELNYKDVQDFFKRYRHSHGPFRFFCVGEYGEQSGHAHWHIIIYGHRSLQPEWMTKAVPISLPDWQRHQDGGFVSDMRLVPASAAYCCGYTLKKGENQLPFMQPSLRPGIGFPRIELFAATVHKKYGSQVIPAPTWHNVDGKKYPLNDGLLRHFRKVYLALGGRLIPVEDPLARSARAMDYAESEDYLGIKPMRRKKLDEQKRRSPPPEAQKYPGSKI